MKGNKSKFDLEDRTFRYAKNTRNLCYRHRHNYFFKSYLLQLLRSSSSIGGNYIEANESNTKKELIYRLTVCLRETKETIYWLNLLKPIGSNQIEDLIEEGTELKNIFSTIIQKNKRNL